MTKTASGACEYAVVRQDIDAHDIPEFVHHSAVTPRKNVVFVPLICFSMGILVGSRLGLLAKPSSPKSSSNLSGIQVSQENVFLKTPRGASVLDSLKEDLHNHGAKFALSRVSSLMDSDEQVASSCHQLTHMLGRTALETFGFQQTFGGLVGTADVALLRTCNAAFMHGVIEQYLKASPNIQEDVEMIETTLCKRLGNVPQGTWECHHGIGHGILQHHRAHTDLSGLQNAIKECRATSFTMECENGLWMDHFASDSTFAELDPSSLQVCYTMAGMASRDCSVYAPTEFLLHNPHAYDRAIEFCNDGLGKKRILAQLCVGGVGMQAGKENQRDYRPVELACQTAPTRKQQDACFQGAIDYYKMTSGLSKVPKSICEPLTVYKDLCHKFSD